MRVKLRKKPMLILIVIIFLFNTLTVRVPLSTGTPDPTVLSVNPQITIDKSKTPGESFSVTIAIDFVENLWGYQFYLSYDTNVLTATTFSQYPIFNLPESPEINDDPTVKDESVGTGDNVTKVFQLNNYPLRPGTDTSVYFAVTNETVGTGDNVTKVFQLSHYPVRNDTPPTDKVYLAVTNETVGTGNGTRRDFYLDHSPVKSGTDMVYLSVKDEPVGTGDNVTKVFQLPHFPVKSGTEKVYLNGDQQIRDIDYSIDYEHGKITFTTAPEAGASVTVDYTYMEPNYNIDYTTGKITFFPGHAPESGAVITADYMYIQGYTIDYDTGVITFVTAPGEGTVVLADYIYIPYVTYTVDYPTGIVTFTTAPEQGIGILMDYKYRAYVFMAFHMQYGASSGFTGSLPSLATIQFTVDALGWSPLDLHGSKLSDPVGNAILHDEVDGYFANLIYDIAVTAVTPSATEVTKPAPVYINATVVNKGDVSETFDVTVYSNETAIETKTVTDLAAGASTTLNFTWDTTAVSPGKYTINATASSVPGEPEIKLSDNTLLDGTVTVNKLPDYPSASFTYSPTQPIERQQITFNASQSTAVSPKHIVSYTWNFSDGTTEIYVEGVNLTDTTTHAYDAAGTYIVTLNVTDNEPLSDLCQETVTVYRHDVAILAVNPSKTQVSKRDTLNIDVTVKNEGNFTETFTVTAYYNVSETEWEAITTNSVTDLPAGASKQLSLPWDTANMSIGTYTVKAVTDIISGEIETDDNTKVDGEVTILPHLHNVAVTDITVSPTKVNLGENVSINVTVANKGDYYEIFTVSATYSKEPIEPVSQKEVSLAAEANKIVSFIWDTTNASAGVHKIKATASLGTDETPNDNSLDFNGTVTLLGHDVAVTDFEVSPASNLGLHRVTPGQLVTIKVKVLNKGTTNETFDVAVYYDDHSIETKTVTELENGTYTWLTFTWNTTGVAEDTYTLKATAATVPGERPKDTGDNTKKYGTKVIIGRHDVAVTDIATSPTVVAVGEPVFINVTVKNEGIFPETFNVTVKYGDTDIATQTVTYMEDGVSTTLTFTWDTTDVTPGTYTIKAEANPVSGELPTDIDDNTLTGLTVGVKVSSTINISANPVNITVGDTTTINGTITPKRAGATVTLWYRLSGEETWNTLTNVQTDENSQYSFDWKPTTAGTYEVKASWAGDAGAFESESDLQVITVKETTVTPGLNLYAVAGMVIAIAAVTMIVYFIKIRKPKPT